MSIVYIISAPSGSGKSTLVNELRRLVPNLDFSVSYTTRKPRGSEQNGQEYFFITRDQFDAMIQQDQFLEYADVFGNYYGTARRFLADAERNGHDLVLDIDVQGAAQIKRKYPDAVSIFILPPSREELEKRLRRRSDAEHMRAEEVIQRRLRGAGREIENYRNYDYILVNDNLGESIEQLKAVVAAERLQRGGRSLSSNEQKTVATAEQQRLANTEKQVQGIVASFTTPARS